MDSTIILHKLHSSVPIDVVHHSFKPAITNICFTAVFNLGFRLYFFYSIFIVQDRSYPALLTTTFFKVRTSCSFAFTFCTWTFSPFCSNLEKCLPILSMHPLTLFIHSFLIVLYFSASSRSAFIVFRLLIFCSISSGQGFWA